MTDGERARLTEAFKTLQVASVKVREGCVEQAVFTMGALALGWVLDEPHYRDQFEVVLRTLRQQGIVLKSEGDR
jgi:hypothetical protein